MMNRNISPSHNLVQTADSIHCKKTNASALIAAREDGAIGTKQDTESNQALINCIPEEILIYIFKFFIDDHESPAVGLLLFVCRDWYEVVEHTPLLWSRIAIHPKRGECNYEMLLGYIDKALAKSQNLPLDIWIDYSQMATESDPPLSFPASPAGLIWQAIGENGKGLARWKTFSLRVKEALSFDDDVWESFGPAAPLLQELHLHIPYIYPWECSLPSLETLVLEGFPGSYDSPFGGFNVVPMKVETLCFRLWGDMDTLGPFSNLRDLIIDNFLLDEEEEDAAKEEVRLDRLECLTIQWVYGYELPVCKLQQLRAPSLKTLRLLGSMAIMLVQKLTCFYHVKGLHLLVEKVEAIRKEIMDMTYIQNYLVGYTGLEDLVIAPWHVVPATEASKMAKAENETPGSLRTLRSIRQDRKGNVIADDASFATTVLSWKSTADFVYTVHIAI